MRQTLQRAVALVTGLFILYTAAAGPYDALVQRSVMVALVITLGFLAYPLRLGGRLQRLGLAIDLVLWTGAVIAALYVTANAERIMTTLPMAAPEEIALTVVLVVAILELARRTVGLAFPILVGIGIAYVFLGHLIPGRLGHRGYDVLFVTETLYLTDIGLWGSLTGIAATIIAAFVLFGAMLLHTGGGETFMNLALLVSGRSTGGAAKMATVASACFGTVNGSAVANVATTGTMTIPLMKRIGYPAPFAGAVEAVASTGGQITPPILGAAAFIMSEMIGVEYLRIALAALIPAMLFYVGVFTTIHLIALRKNIGVVPAEQIPSVRVALDPVRLLPVICGLTGLIWMMASGRSVVFAAAFGIAAIVLPFVIGDLIVNRQPLKTAKSLLDGLVEAGNGIVIIALMLAGAQILVALINLTGVGVTLSSLTVAIGGESLVLIGLIVAVACLILGMGIPTTAAYVLVAAVMAPALITVGVEPLVAHMFVFYYATISVITPPVCIAVFVAASIARTDWWPTALNAVRLAAVTYVVPFMFLSYPGMLWSGSSLDIVEAVISGGALVLATSLFLSGTQIAGGRLVPALLYLPAAALAIVPSEIALVASIALIVTGIVIGRPFRHRETPPGWTASELERSG
ncbi:TRAP transporter fused permease subunit [Acuticoccus sp. M5D2P5]|uniref:TRAP transporter permease n=1 Tax=Acuticoccus kalidii TaxID=2910977 RepID=UPI001F484A50|nr:TRAP transporter fused permease subunit [Acuticoccus kalidii]MCF3933992.1 TRAP transporter fused permease subunit [Acuticoccus kalidii]